MLRMCKQTKPEIWRKAILAPGYYLSGGAKDCMNDPREGERGVNIPTLLRPKYSPDFKKKFGGVVV
jgi:hypothetical protein